jgi:hypothetical protein
LGVILIRSKALDKTYKLSDKQVSTALSGESVILNHAIGTYFSLNEVGTYIWELLNERQRSVSELVKEVLGEFEIESVVCQKDIKKLLKSLENEGLVEEV